MICKNCGTVLEDGLRICPICGEETSTASKKRKSRTPLILLLGLTLFGTCLFAGSRLIAAADISSVPAAAPTEQITQTTLSSAQETASAKETTNGEAAPAAETSSSETAPTDQTPSSETVYVTKSGTKYHKSTCSHLRTSKIEMPLADAKAHGYTPCSHCFDKEKT